VGVKILDIKELDDRQKLALRLAAKHRAVATEYPNYDAEVLQPLANAGWLRRVRNQFGVHQYVLTALGDKVAKLI
jgi:hypothetical protein